MEIGDVRPKDPSNQDQETFPNDTTPPAQGLDKIIMKKMLNQMIKAIKRAMIKWEMRMMGIK
jgi:hypothetical protein